MSKNKNQYEQSAERIKRLTSKCSAEVDKKTDFIKPCKRQIF